MKGLYSSAAARVADHCSGPLVEKLSQGDLLAMARERLAAQGLSSGKDPALFAAAVDLQAKAVRRELEVVEKEAEDLRAIPKIGRPRISSEDMVLFLGAFWAARAKLHEAGLKTSARKAAVIAGKRLGVSAERIRKAQNRFLGINKIWRLPPEQCVDLAARIAITAAELLDDVEQEASRNARGPKLLLR